MVEPACSLCELVVSEPGGVVWFAFRSWGGFDSGRSFLATRLNRLCHPRSWLSRPASVSEWAVSKPGGVVWFAFR